MHVLINSSTNIVIGISLDGAIDPVDGFDVLEIADDTSIAPGLIYNPTAQTFASPPIAPAALSAYAGRKQDQVLGQAFSHTLADGSATLDTKCDTSSMTFLNSLVGWSLMNASSTTASRTYYNLDGSAHVVTPAELQEFLVAVGAHVQATFDSVSAIRAKIVAGTITATADIDAYAWTS